ncbi:MAG: tyrosine-type recombinase/integrase [Prevotellaceae bacterium]|nr:tyrosine-type recombinase/integrase [Prevotellaceae bacterium]
MIDEDNIDIFAIPARLQAKKRRSMTFLEYYADKAETYKHGLGVIRQGRYDLVLRVLREYGKIRTFDDLTERNIIYFDNYLKKKGINPSSRYNNYHKFLKRFIVDGMREGLTRRNPYDTVRLDHGDFDHSIDKCLTLDEVKQLENATMEPRLERVRDLFVFHCYTCMSYSDLAKFDSHLIQIFDGKKVYCGRRGKTKVRFTVPLLPPALDILKKYNAKLPMLSNVKYNAYLKEVVAAAGIHKPITTHWARHTGATLLLNAGVPMEIVSKVCGHSSVKMTEKIYAKMLPKTVVAAVNEVEDKII